MPCRPAQEVAVKGHEISRADEVAGVLSCAKIDSMCKCTRGPSACLSTMVATMHFAFLGLGLDSLARHCQGDRGI